MSARPENIVVNATFEFLLKQIYAVHKEEVRALKEQLASANDTISKLKSCPVCKRLTSEVEDLKQQVHQLIKTQNAQLSLKLNSQKDAEVQSDFLADFSETNRKDDPIGKNSPTVSIQNGEKDQEKQLGLTVNGNVQHEALSQNSFKHLLVLSPVSSKKRFCASFLGDCTPKNDSPSVEEVELAPNTPEYSPQRRYRVRKWLQTMEIPETIAPDYLGDGRIPIEAVGNDENEEIIIEHAGSKGECNSHTEMDNIDDTILPSGFIAKNLIDNQSCIMEIVPVAIKREIEEIQVPSDASTASEDLLHRALVTYKSKQNSDKNFVRQDTGNKMKLGNDSLAKPAQNRKGPHKDVNMKSSFDVIKKETVLPYKYKEETVRKKDERKRLPAQVCANCVNYFGEVGVRQRDLCSKHRATYAAPITPENYWELGIPDTPICKERGYIDITQKVSLLSRRKKPLKLADPKK